MKTYWLFLNALILVFTQTTAWASEKDSDHDGVKDSVDQCPKTAQLKKVDPNFTYAVTVNPERRTPGPKAWPVLANGCEPDSDKDGVINSKDYCPNDSKEAISRGVASNGCPVHSDSDGTPDFRDNCPNTPKGVKTDKFGCAVGKNIAPQKEHVAARIKKIFK